MLTMWPSASSGNKEDVVAAKTVVVHVEEFEGEA